MSHSLTLEAACSFTQLPENFPVRGGRLIAGVLAWERAGEETGPLVGVLGGISAGRHVCATTLDRRPGFWGALAGEGRALDPRSCSLMGIDWIGGAGASSGPCTSGLGWDFPAVSTHDQARALALWLDEQGLERFDALVGASFGGMVALAFAELFPARVGRLVVISAAQRSSALASAWRHVQAQLLALGREQRCEARAVELARALALTTYRGSADWERRGGRAGVASYLDSRGAQFAQRFDAAAYALLSRAADEHEVDAGAIRVPADVVGCASDLLVPWSASVDLARSLGGAVRLHELHSSFGHDAFLKEGAQLDAIVRAALASEGGAR